jgi:signal transduction histidine kinase
LQRKIAGILDRFSLTQQFMLVSLVILLIGMLGLGWWVGKQIETGVINRTASEKALYVNSFIHPALENYVTGTELDPENIQKLDNLIKNSPLAQNVVSFKVWNLDGKIIYSSSQLLVGRAFTIKNELERAMQGDIVAIISDLDDEEDVPERNKWNKLLETYSPVTKSSTNQIIAVVEFYQEIDSLLDEIEKAQISSWLVLGVATLMVFLILSVFVQRASVTINHQRSELKSQVSRLTELLSQNAELHERVRQASSRSATLNERLLRRISAELHDGPAQDLGYVLLRLDGIQPQSQPNQDLSLSYGTYSIRLNEIKGSLQHAMQEIRAIASGMGLPELDTLSLEQTLTRVVRAHEQRTGTKVDFSYSGMQNQGSISVKIIVYRLVQEALNNSYRHAGGKGQRVKANCDQNELCIEISDQGPGFDIQQDFNHDGHLGLSGIYDRVTSLGGRVQIKSIEGQGTLILAQIPLETGEIK